MNTAALKEKDRTVTAGRRAITTTSTALTVVNRVKPINEDLRIALEAYQKRNELSDTQLGKQLGTSATYPFKYIANKFEGDVEKFESSIVDLLRIEQLREVGGVELFKTLATNQTARHLDAIGRKTQIGMVYGDAGEGKTSGARLYTASSNLAVYICINACSGTGSRAIVNELWEHVDPRGFTSKKNPFLGSRGAYVTKRFKDGKRLIIVDNAHDLSAAGRKWLCSFCDATGCSIALVGNAEMLEDWRRLEQQISRIGYRGKVSLMADKGDRLAPLRAAVSDYLSHAWPEAATDIMELAVVVTSKAGHLRALAHQISTAQYLLEHKAATTAAGAFRAAHDRLGRDYQLPV